MKMKATWGLFIYTESCLLLLASSFTVDNHNDDSHVGESSRFTLFTAMADMADRAANTFSDSFLPSIHKTGRGGQRWGSRFTRKFKTKQKSPNFIEALKDKLPKFGKKFPKRLSVPKKQKLGRKHLQSKTSSGIKVKFPGNNIRTVSGPDLSKKVDKFRDVELVTTRTSSSHFTVTPTPSGVFEVDPISIVSPTPSNIRIIQPIQIVTSSSTTQSPRQFRNEIFSSPFSSSVKPPVKVPSSSTFRSIFSPVTQSPRIPKQKSLSKSVRPSVKVPPSSTFRSIFSPVTQSSRRPKQNSPALTFDDPIVSRSRPKSFSRQEIQDNDISDLTPLGVRLSLEEMLRSAGQEAEMRPIPGDPGVDYPVFSEVPDTDFNCAQQEYPGIYTDVEAQCQVFHMCEPETGKINSFLCPNGTIFSQQYFVCDWWYNHDCAAQQSFANLNQFLYQENENEIRCKTLFCIND